VFAQGCDGWSESTCREVIVGLQSFEYVCGRPTGYEGAALVKDDKSWEAERARVSVVGFMA